MAENKLPVHICCAAGVVLNEKDEVLLVKDIRRGWMFPGGIIESGETPIEGLKREIMEETGVTVSVGELFCVSSDICTYKGYNGVEVVPTKLILDFICRYEDGEPRPSEENTESVFVPRRDVLGMMSLGSHRERFGAFLGYNGRPRFLEFRTRPDYELLSERDI